MRIVLIALGALLAGCAAPPRSKPPAVRVADGPALSTGDRQGPTIRLSYGGDGTPPNPMADFTYFVPLISPEPVDLAASPGNTQAVRVLSMHGDWDATSFCTRCDFEIVGRGCQRYTFDHAPRIRRSHALRREGGTLPRLLHFIHFEDGGRGCVETRGRVEGQVATVTEVVLRFGLDGPSPVTVSIHDLRREGDNVVPRNAIVARVDALIFRRSDDPPRMGVTLGSVKPADAGESWWEKARGRIAARVANLVVKPLRVERIGRDALLAFGRALARREPTFTFPRAPNLRRAASE
ncbi:MAG: hypothetical protein ACODAJ_12590 [Planctomycetota bacterium]